MQAVAFAFLNGNVHLYLPPLAKDFTGIPEGVVVFKSLNDVPSINYATAVFASYTVPTIQIQIDNKDLRFNETVIKSRYFKALSAVYLLELPDDTLAFGFEIVFAGIVDTWSYQGNISSVVIR